MNIWKFTLVLQTLNRIEMPTGARVLSVANQHEYVCLWAEIPDPSAPKIDHVFVMRVTGDNPLSIDHQIELRFLGTVLLADATFVAHIYEAIKKE